ncbi:DEAD/DEAH box helicase [Fictibacillus enclensis]|uniref:DEAD/DEAH box helicase n=1 Tax=Fictibacillus enclensis TaxID=1017270 RepID=UPI0024C0CAEF|nr:AAA domain-containing protein [Fictibacillus enclensis]WHY72669.1 AAA domain-containing protein [Fictibacillus enclensis]
MTGLEEILQAWWHSETLSPGEVPSDGELSSEYTDQKIDKLRKLTKSEIRVPELWNTISFKAKDMKRYLGFYGSCYREYNLIQYQRDLHNIKEEIHNKSLKPFYGFYVEFDENDKYVNDSLFVPYVNLFVSLTLENKTPYDKTFFERYQEAIKYLSEKAESLNGGIFSSSWLSQFTKEFDNHFAIPPSDLEETQYIELIVATDNYERAPKFNSFFSEDILKAKEDMNSTIRQYLMSPQKIDINENRTFIEKSLHPSNTPLGRWPSPIEHRLSLMQQVAVNEFFTSSCAISSVNGPPGTGKTTLLKDIFAEIVVKKAIAILPFRDNPKGALVPTDTKISIKNRYTAKEERRIVYDIEPSIAHYAAVVASSNNTAVENISKDLPKLKEIDSHFEDELKPLKYTSKISEKITESESWGAFSIPLGKGDNIKKAASLITGEKFSIMNSLYKIGGSKLEREKEWHQACDDFKNVYEEVKKIRQTLVNTIDYSVGNPFHPDEKFIDSTDFFWEETKEKYEERQEKVLFQTNTLNEKRSVLFLKALTVLRHFLSINKGRIEAALSLLHENRDEVDINSESGIRAIKAMWNTVHCVFPVISTTFASFSSMYRGMPKDFIPYLFIDEAGQATPLQAVGALWRSEKVLVVGDPLQIEPVQTLQPPVMEDIRNIYQIEEELLNLKCSVQSVADRANPYGTYVNKNNWIGIPLWVHRRCIEPMFSISNKLAYDGKMVLPNKKIGEGKWLSCQGTAKSKQYVAEQTEELIKHIKESMTKALREQLLGSIKSKLAEDENMEHVLQAIVKKESVEESWSVSKKQSFILMEKYYKLKNRRTPEDLYKEIQEFNKGEYKIPNIYVISPFSEVKNKLKIDIKKNLFNNMIEWLDSEVFVKGTDEEAFKLEKTLKEEIGKFKKWYEKWIKESIGTVHTFQGKEADIVYFVTGTDASQKKAAEWACKEPNLLNVAVTRAKKEFYIIGDKPILENFANYKTIIEIMNYYMERKRVNEVR